MEERNLMAQTQVESATVASQEYRPLSATVSRGRLVSILVGVMLGIPVAVVALVAFAFFFMSLIRSFSD
jgi:hypothetical protein